MNGIRLVISDVDGTLVDLDKQLTPATIAAVERLRDAGIGFSLVSARPTSGILALGRALDVTMPMAAFNGGETFTSDGTIVGEHLVPADIARDTVAMARDAGLGLWVFANGKWYADDADGPHSQSERRASAQEPVETDDFAPLFDRVAKLTFVSDDPAVIDPLATAMKERFGDAATIALSQSYYLDVTARKANKGVAVEMLAAEAGVPLSAVAVIGDMRNDLPMFAKAGLSIAMGQAPDDVKAAADHVTRGNDADGVAHAIDTIILA
ncbi:hypothetical protein ASE75_00170 [Sphingomonas sp. Leaf17]|uniref:Cof-type HAD-IIB family hydrolase n=1 Tax=Sphingomonas sp. Leaf17 TaxID=1735683 RepID=UPI0006F3B1E2|nr:Cof-type HAD-IIB family hydrolase [Sphingomonas sp. Leaf17]KQM67420.1 hypothetical protein ASE75_00170 [Sphingomonas sp. Leaf17]